MRKLKMCGLSAVLMVALVLGSFALPSPSGQVAEANPGTQWNAAYYNNATLSGSPATQRIDDQINFNWAAGAPAGVAVGADNFSVRWTKTVNFATSGQWTFRAGADDGIRMWIDTTLLIDEWHDANGGFQVYTVTLDGLTAGNHDLKVEYYENTGLAGVQVQWWSGAGGVPSGGTGATGAANWTAYFYNNTNVTDPVVATQNYGDLNFDWGNNAPTGGVNADNFSARFTARVNFAQAGQWRFRVGADDGVRLWIDVTQIINEWHGSATGYAEYEVTLSALTAGEHDIRLEYFDSSGAAKVNLRWEFLGGTGGGGAAVGPTATPFPTATPVPRDTMAGVTGDRVNVRSGPGLGNPVITQVYYPDDYLVLGGVPDLSWILIDLGGGAQGWVSNEWVYLYNLDPNLNIDTTGGGQPDFVDIIPRIDLPIAPPSSIPPVEERPQTILQGVATDTVRLRDGASSTAADVIGSVPAGARFTVEARNYNGAWYLIEYLGIRGWVSAPYVRLTTGRVNQLVVSSEVVPAPPFGEVFVPTNEQGQPAVTVRGRANSNLRLRDGATLFSEQFESVPQNAEFVIQARNYNGAWYLITYNGQVGWVNAAYVTLIEGRVPDLPIQ